MNIDSVHIQSAHDLVGKASRELAKEQDALIMEQLSDFATRGLIVVERTGPSMYMDRGPKGEYLLRIEQSCRLRLKDRDYILELEGKVKCLQEEQDRLLTKLTLKEYGPRSGAV